MSGTHGARKICIAAIQQTLHVSRTGGDETSQPQVLEKEVLYRGRWMIPFRVLVRLKIFQLAGVASLAIPLNSFLLEVEHTLAQHIMSTLEQAVHGNTGWHDLANFWRVELIRIARSERCLPGRELCPAHPLPLPQRSSLVVAWCPQPCGTIPDAMSESSRL